MEFSSEHGLLTIVAQPDDDTVDVRQGSVSARHRYVLTGSAPLSQVVGRTALWVGLLRNQQGYQDGFQIEFNKDNNDFTLQMICEASTLHLSILTEALPPGSPLAPDLAPD